MRTRTAIVLGASLLLAASAHALLRPPEGTALPDYDVRTSLKGVLKGAAPGPFQVRLGRAAAPRLGPARVAALERLRQEAGPGLVVRWNPLTEAPRVLFRHDGPLTPPDNRDPGDIARSFLQAHAELFDFEPETLGFFEETRRFTTSQGSLTILELEQYLEGVNVFRSQVRFAITPRGEVASVTAADTVGALAGASLVPALDGADAVLEAARSVGAQYPAPPVRLNPASEPVAVYERGPLMSEPRLRPVLFPMGKGVRLAYQVFVELADRPAYYELVVDGSDGSVLLRYNLTRYVQTHGLVFPEDPGVSPQQDVPFYDDQILTDARWPLGWAFADRSIGNVADAKEDWAGDNETTIGQRSQDFPAGPPYFFQDPWTNSYETTRTLASAKLDAPAAVTNLFYLANDFHNWLYEYGFDEAAGNWQKDNFGRGGRGGDWVYVDAQDGANAGRRNNANMATPPDGNHPRAQFFLFAPPFVYRDSSVDGDVVRHEFAHGLSHRLVGGANTSSCLSGFQSSAMGEGWSDFYACARYGDPRVGEYATGDATNGIRGAPYDNYPACHQYTATGFCTGNACGGICDPTIPGCPLCEVHDEGELWAVALWEMRTLLIANFPPDGAEVALRIVTDGMKLTACNPTFLDARDGILLADLYNYGGIHACTIWKAFADRYMGFSATSPSSDDTTPNGQNDLPAFCMNNGEVFLDFPSYACADTLVATVLDNNASAPVTVTLRSAPTGDVLANVATTGAAPSFTTGPISVVQGPATADALLQVNPGDTITVEYTDSNPAPPTLKTDTAPVNCLAQVETRLGAEGGCSLDSAAGWPVTLPQILDAGERVDLKLTVHNREPKDLTNVTVSVTGVSDPRVWPLVSGPVSLGDIPAVSGAATATIPVGASMFAAAGTVTLDFLIQADGYTGTASAVRYTIPVHSDYRIVSGTTGVEDFEASDGGFTSYPWPYAAPTNEWVYGICGANSGSKSWHAGPASCAGNAAEQDANLETPVINPLTPTRVSWYPTELSFWHRLSLGSAGANLDNAFVAVSEPSIFNGGDIATGVVLDPTDNTGGNWQQLSLPLTAADTLGSAIETDRGLVFWFDFWTLSSSALSQEWGIDDVEVKYSAVDAVASPGPAACRQAGYTGDLASCAGGTFTLSLYNTARPAEMQFAGNGQFWSVPPGWNAFDAEFPTPTSIGETVVFLANENAGGGTHPGRMAVNGKTIMDPTNADFGTSTCAPIPTPVGPVAPVAAGQQIRVTWSPFPESGTGRVIVGYNVYRVNAEAFPPATSTIADYLGGLRGSTVGQANIHEYLDVAPPVGSPPTDSYTYAIQPLLRCDGTGCTGPVAARFGGSESNPGTANLSTDSNPVEVSPALLASFSRWGAVREGSVAVVTWSTASEIDTLAFDVFRGPTTDERAMTAVGRVWAHGPGDYELRDAGAPSGTHYYQLREVSVNQPTRTPVFALTDAGGPGTATREGARTGGSRRRSGATSQGSGEASDAASQREGRIR